MFSPYESDLHADDLSAFGRQMYGDYKTDVSFTVAQGTLLW